MPLVPALPAPLGKNKELLLKAVAFVTATADDVWDYVTQASAIEDVEWRYLVARFSRTTPVGTVEDMAQIGFNITNITGGDLDTTWTTQDYTTCEAHFTELFTTLRSSLMPSHKLVDWRWYKRAFNPAAHWGQSPLPGEVRFAKSGPPERITPVNLAGTAATGALPYQAAVSVTFRTPTPRHWGRVYWPGYGAGSLDANGRWGSGAVLGIANAHAELKDDLEGSEFQLVVPTTQIDNVLQPALQTVGSIQVDDIPDVIRRRRPRQAGIKQLGAPTP